MTTGTTSDASASPARAIRLVYCDESGKFQMDPEALSVLKLIKEPIGVVSVCGCARQGKSYILNQLLGRSSGFQVASTHRPCTKGHWLWSTPIRRTALDGTEYNLLLIDSEGIDAYDQTGTYSTQIFPLAVLLSSMFIYNQMGGIDEAAIDRLSLVAEMTKHIRVRASTTPSELGQFSPTFVWLLRDFYLDLVEDNRKITPRDYLELALRPVQGGGSAKNEIRESIRGLFPDRDCFTLVRPLSNENELQRLDLISMDQLRPEFKTGLDALTRYVFERTRPKQVGATVMTGPIFAGITQSFLDALNNGAVPTIASAWQISFLSNMSVEETECQRALEYASEVYKSSFDSTFSFDSTKPPEEATIREAHEEAVQKALAAFNSMAVGAGSVRQRCEKSLHTFFRKELEDYKRAYDMQCTNAVQKMEKEVRTACQAPGAKFDDILKVLDQLSSSYETTSYGPQKWQKLASFLRQSLKGPVVDFVKRNSSSLDERYSNLSKAFEAAKHESLEWKRKYEVALSKQKAGEDEVENLKASSSAAEARLAAASEQTLSTQEEADEWKRRYDVAVKEAKRLAEKGDLHMKNYKLHELRAIAKKRKIPHYAKYRKLELAQMLETDSFAVKETSRSKPKMQHGMIQSTTTWFDLSLDLKVNILSRVVAIEKLGNVHKVCRDWREICKDPSVWRVIYMDSEFYSDCRPYHWPSGLPRDEITARRMCRNAVDRSQGQLVDITMIGFCDDELLEYVADRSPKLIRLEIVFPEYSVGSLIKALKKLPKLEELSLYYADESQVDQALGSYCPELKTLRLNHIHDIGDAKIIAISQNLRELRHLEIQSNYALTDSGVQAILDGCPCLKVLDLRLCVRVDLKGDIEKRLEQIECVLHTEAVKCYPFSGIEDLTDLKIYRKNILEGDFAVLYVRS